MLELICLAQFIANGSPAKPEFHAPTPKKAEIYGGAFPKPGQKVLQGVVITINAPVVRVSAFPIDGVKWLMRDPDKNRRPTPLGPAVWRITKDLTKRSGGQTGRHRQYQKSFDLPATKPGVYLFLFEAKGASTWSVANITSLSIVVRRSPTHLLVWATDSVTGAVVKNAQVRYVPHSGAPTTSGVTGSDGACLVPLKVSHGVVVVTKNREVAGVDTEIGNPDGTLTCLLLTDRPIYRPGQTVNFKGILRLTQGQGYRVAANAKVTVALRDSQQVLIDRQNLQSNSQGSVSGSFTIPRSGSLNDYNLELTLGKQTANQSVSVQEYRKPEFKVDIEPGQKRYISGQDIHFRLNSAYYYGSPLSQAEVKWQVTKQPTPFRWSEDDDQSGDSLPNGLDQFIYRKPEYIDGSAVTDNHGHADVVIHTKPGFGDNSYEISATVTDSSRRAVSGSGEVNSFAAALRIGVVCAKETVPIGQTIPVEVHVVDLQGMPADAQVELEAKQWFFDPKQGWHSRSVGKVVGFAHHGRATLNMPALVGGQIQLVASAIDGSGRRTSDSTIVFVDDHKSMAAPVTEPPKVEMKLDKHSYRPGDLIRASVKSNRPNRPVLIVESGGDIWGYKVLYPGKGLTGCSFATSAQLSPTVFLTATMANSDQQVQTMRTIQLPNLREKLSVQVVAGKKEFRPGEEVSLRVRATDSNKVGVASDFALGVADESLFALTTGSSVDPYENFWDEREDLVQDCKDDGRFGLNGHYFSLDPKDVVGGSVSMGSVMLQKGQAYSGRVADNMLSSVDAYGLQVQPNTPAAAAPIAQKIRQSFKDTAYWNAFVQTDKSGLGEVRFTLPDDLTTWRATGVAVTGDTRGGFGTANLVSTRPVTFRLSAPRIVSKGDELTVLGTIDNRTAKDRTFKVDLSAEGVSLTGQTEKRVLVKAHDSAIMSWKLKADEVPSSGAMTLTGHTLAEGATSAEEGDALQISVPVVPRGVSETNLLGGTIVKSAGTGLNLPDDTLSQGSLITVTVSAGLNAMVRESALSILQRDPYGTMSGVNALKAAIAIHAPARSDAVREAFAQISKNHREQGWGWWSDAPINPTISSEVAYTLAMAARAGYEVDPQLKKEAIDSCLASYKSANQWEEKARLVSALLLLRSQKVSKEIAAILKNGQYLSPFAKLRLAEALLTSDPATARRILTEVESFVSAGPDSSILPVGDEPGWAASSSQTAAQLLIVLQKLNESPEMQTGLVKYLVTPGPMEYRSDDEQADVVVALARYAASRPDAKKVGDATVTINGHAYPLQHSTVSESASVEIRDPVLTGGTNSIELKRSGGGEAFYSIQAKTYVPTLTESIRGVRVTRRYETKSAAGIWSEINGPIKAGSEVRCTVVVWGDSIPDAVRVTEPVPAGFEFIQDEGNQYEVNEEQRDGAMVHYFLNSGSPIVLRYYLRAETDGSLIALPAVAEYLRRPATRGHSSATEMIVKP